VTPQELQTLLESVRDGTLSVADGVDRFRGWPTLELGHSRLDLQRELRCGHPEVVFGAGKRPAELVEIATALAERHGRLLVTRVAPLAGEALLAALPDAEHHELARAVTLERGERGPGTGCVLVLSAGTSDRPVAEEAALTARMLGARVEARHDVGVAGLHRLLAEREALRAARVLVVVAGMEGALPSVVGGLVDRPVVAVPTSVGYGASFGGLAALLAMLNSCAPGVTVVNVDNGFGAGYAAALMNRTLEETQER
jgi:NCAIR mutase (PurE)-related protein